jgi:hypothetical protein
MNKKFIENIKYYHDLPYYYKDVCYSKVRYYLQTYINTTYSPSKITDNIYISDFPSACNKDKLKEDGITHILCAILGLDPIFPDDFSYKNIHVRDVNHENLNKYFDESVDFIDSVVKSGGKVLVHCSYGVSRSASIVIAYLMKKHELSYDDAYEYVKNRRDIIEPNNGFKEQLKNF